MDRHGQTATMRGRQGRGWPLPPDSAVEVAIFAEQGVGAPMRRHQALEVQSLSRRLALGCRQVTNASLGSAGLRLRRRRA